MKKILLFSILSGSSLAINAATDFDNAMLKAGIVDEQYQVVNDRELNEVLRGVTNKVAHMFPSKIDAYTTILSVNVSRFGIYANYQLDEVETKKDAEYVLYNFGLAQDYKNYLCSSEFANSETFKKLNAKFNVNFLNSESSVIYTLKIPMSSCR
ncbi:hypothetical protein [Acinetobacter indicus]|uniref:hypothetical protein n=1 Tax=Acinetobacter indicus TaxID=756892 RepID=UPI000CEBF03C|nr:hypothetical protein [Acinetobacter indicus]